MKASILIVSLDHSCGRNNLPLWNMLQWIIFTYFCDVMAVIILFYLKSDLLRWFANFLWARWRLLTYGFHIKAALLLTGTYPSSFSNLLWLASSTVIMRTTVILLMFSVLLAVAVAHPGLGKGKGRGPPVKRGSSSSSEESEFIFLS